MKRKYVSLLLALAMLFMIACTGCVTDLSVTETDVTESRGDITAPAQETDQVSESSTATGTEAETGQELPEPRLSVEFEFEDLDNDGCYTFRLDNAPSEKASFVMRITTRRKITISLNDTELLTSEAGIVGRFYDLSKNLDLLRRGENTIKIQGGRGSDMKITLDITADGFFESSIITPDLTSNGFAMENGLFGVNAEITRKGFFGGLSAQMLNNRKLLMGANSVDGWTCTRFERVTDRPEESLCESNFIILKDGGSMKQTSEVITLQNNKEYEAKVWVKAISDTAKVTFGVKGMEQTFTVSTDREAYHELSFTFTGKTVNEGTFTVQVEGEVAVYELSLMPTDNFYGMRWDVIESLRALAPTSIRYPGGCFADHFEWRECLKSPELRKPVNGSIKDFMLRDTYGQDCMDIGINEFMMLCREVGAEPEFTVSILQSDGADARDLIEYCNGSADTEYGAIRQSLGYDAFNIKTWYVGNEVYYFGAKYQRDGVAAAQRTSEIVNAMRTVDPDIAVILSVVADTNLQKWSYDFIGNLTCTYELISYHRYNGSAPNAEPDGKTACDNLEGSFKNDTDAGLEFYKNYLFKDTFDTIRICVDEWNFCWGSGSNNALLFSNALEFHFFARTAEKYHICEARFFMPINEGMITVTGTDSKIESSGELFRLMAGHRGGQVITCTSDNDDLDILCTEHDGYLFVSVVNRSATPYRISTMGYDVSDCTEIKSGEFSFFSNEYDIIQGDDPTICGHSVLFMTLKQNDEYSSPQK